MSVLDKFLNAMKLNDDEDYEDGGDGYLDDDVRDFDDDDDSRSRRVIRSRDEDEDDEDDEPAPSANTAYRRSTASSERRASRDRNSESAEEPQRAAGSSGRSRSSASSASSKVSPIRSRRPKGDRGMEVCVIRPHSMEDAKEITETLLDGCTVVLNVEGLELEIAQRIIDFASGSCFAIDGNLQKVSSYIFIITPSTVDISGDFQDLVSGAFDVPFEKRYSS